jgi:6-phosphogluconate dehydrogenase
MKLAMIGLGKMGANMTRRLIQAHHQVVGYARSRETIQALSKETGMLPAYSVAEAVKLLEKPKIVWVMVPSGDPTDDVINSLAVLLSEGDIVIDGGNSHYTDTLRRLPKLEEKSIHFVDAGVSGGIWGLTEGYSMMVGGEEAIVEYLTPIFSALAPGEKRGWGRVGPHGAGHFVKMVHNGVEYGMMEAYAEGYELLRASQEFELDLRTVTAIWRYGSVVRSWLLDLIGNALSDDPDLKNIKGWVEDSGEGRWTSAEGINRAIPTPAITMALYRRFYSRQEDSYAAKLLAAMRHQFGGHAIKKE